MSDQTFPEPICCFRDALGLAMQLHHQVHEDAFWTDSSPEPASPDPQHLPSRPTAVAVAFLSTSGECLDLGVFRKTSVASAGHWAIGICGGFEGRTSAISKVLLTSLRPQLTQTIHESDLELFRSIRWQMSTVGAELVDWIETDGDHVRSFAYLTCPITAWMEEQRSSDSTYLEEG